MIGSFDGDYRFLSNFYPAEVFLDVDIFPSVEHAYQAAKAMDAAQHGVGQEEMVPTINRILSGTATQAKRIGKQVRLAPGWDDRRDDVMYTLLVRKFMIPELRNKLLATGEEELVEGNWWHDNYWGSCTHCGPGQNKLGQLLMRVRREIQMEQRSRKITQKYPGWVTFTFTGHRPGEGGTGYDFHCPRRTEVRRVLYGVLKKLQDAAGRAGLKCQSITGGALGFDHDALAVSHDLGWPCCVAEPHEGHGGNWPDHSKRFYSDLLFRTTTGRRIRGWRYDGPDKDLDTLSREPRFYFGKIVTVSPGGYSGLKMQIRNEWMIRRADVLVAFYSGKKGGTQNAVRFHKKLVEAGAVYPLIIINPNDLSVTGHGIKV